MVAGWSRRAVARILTLVLATAWCLLLTLPARAADTLAGAGAGIEEEYRAFISSLPDEVVTRLPGDLFPSDVSTDFSRVAEGVAQMSSLSYLLETAGEILSVEWGTAWRILARTVGLLMIVAVASALCRSFRSEALSRAVSLGVSCALLLSVIDTMYAQLQKVVLFLSHLAQLVNALLPLMTALHLMGGNVAVAAAQNGSLMLFLTVCENVCATTLLPMTGLCLCLTVVGILSPTLPLRSLSAWIKNSYAKTLGLLMLLLSFTLSAQTVLRAAADSLTARVAKFAAGNLIPVVGGALGDTLRTVASGVTFLKSTVGVGAMIILLLLVMPVLIGLLLSRLSLRLSLTVAELLGCENEKGLLNELWHIYGMLIAVVSVCCVMLILALTLFVRVSTA